MRSPEPMPHNRIWQRLGEAGLGLALRASFALAPEWTADTLADRLCVPGARRRPPDAHDGNASHVDVRIDGRRVLLHVWGNPHAQPYVLASHGWQSGGHRFAAWAPALAAKGHALIAVDQPAHGASDGRRASVVDFACTLLALAHRFGSPSGVIGHSLGGLATIVALGEGLPAARVALVATPSDLPSLLATRLAGLRLPGDLLEKLTGRFELEAGMPLSELDIAHYGRWLGCPALVMHDQDDREVPYGDAERIARLWPMCCLIRTRGLGHHRILSHPRVIRTGTGWIARADPSSLVGGAPSVRDADRMGGRHGRYHARG